MNGGKNLRLATIVVLGGLGSLSGGGESSKEAIFHSTRSRTMPLRPGRPLSPSFLQIKPSFIPIHLLPTWYLAHVETDRNLFLPKYSAEYLTEYSAETE